MLRGRAYTGLTNLSGGFTRRRKFPRQKALVPEMASRAALALTGAHAATLAFFAVVVAAVSIAGVAAVGALTECAAAGRVDATITVDTQRPGLVISPYVYGSAWGQWVGKLPPDDEVADLRVRLIRFGGNNISRYNWRIDTYNDWWTKRNVVQTPGLLEFVTWARSHGAEPLIQVNAFGFAPAETSSTEMSRIMDADAAADLVRFLNVQHGLGVRFFEIDNEPFIWHETHRDYQKRPIGYDEYLERFVEFSRAMKEVDPSIVVMGPSNCNPTYYLRSALAGDRVVKGDWIPYMLRYCAEYEARHGLRVLDAVSFHRYPIYRSFSAKEVRAKPQDILDATREWWDPLYNPTILDPTSEPAVRAILPLFRRWIDQNYPGTALALTEYNLDFDSSIEYPPDVRALWLAEVLGQLARHEVRYSVYWNLQEEGHHGLVRMDGRPTGTYHVFRLYSHNLTGRMLPVKGELARVHAFAALNQDGTVAVLVNNLDLEAGCDVELVLSEVSGSRRVHLALEPGSVTAITVAPGDAKAMVEIFDP